MTRWLRWFFVSWPLLLAPLPAWADGPTPTWSVVPPVAYPETSNDAHGQAVTTYSMTVLENGGTFPAGDYWLRFEGRTPLLACTAPRQPQPPSRGPLDLS